jgi:hypothetical protein
VIVLVIDLDGPHFRELPECGNKGLRNAVLRAVRLAIASEIDRQYAVGEIQPAIANIAALNDHQATCKFVRRGPLEILV